MNTATASVNRTAAAQGLTETVLRLGRDPVFAIAATIVMVYLLAAVGAALGWWAQDWRQPTGNLWAGPSAEHWLGTNILGQDIFQRALYSTRTAFEVGLLVSLAATVLGALSGAVAGYFQGRVVDEAILWLKGVLDAIPFYLFVAAIAFAFQDNPWSMHVAMIATFWTTTARLVRGEIIRLREMDFVLAARAIGLGHGTILLRHLLPNTYPLLLIQGSLTFVAAIKAEVILSFLGLGVEDSVSWGVMLAESTQEVLSGHFQNFLTASVLLFVLVMAFNLLADGLQDAVDPRLVRRHRRSVP